MTARRLRELVARYQRRLGLLHWTIEVDLDTELQGTRNAEVRWAWSYDSAVVVLDAGEWPGWSPDYAERIVAHELLHVLTRDLCVAASEAADCLPKAARKVVKDRWDHELEGVVERLAAVLAGS